MTDLDNPESLISRGEALRLERRTEEALGLFRNAISISPDFVRAHRGLVLSLMSLGMTGQALLACKAGLRCHPNDKTLNVLIIDLLISSRSSEALQRVLILLDQYPEDNRIWLRFGMVISSVPIKISSVTRPWLLKVLNHPVVSDNIVTSIWNGLIHESPISELISLSQKDGLGDGEKLKEWLAVLGADTLLIDLMEIRFVSIPSLEHLFTQIRHALLFKTDASSISPAILRFCSALATQAFISDYSWFVDVEEDDVIDRLAQHIGHVLANDPGHPFLPIGIVLYGMYRPLYGLGANNIGKIIKQSWPDTMAGLMRVQLLEPIKEVELGATVSAITPVTDDLSLQVRAMYEENPYPRWTKPFCAPGQNTVQQLTATLGGQPQSDPTFSGPDVLIAGCGTGKQSIFAASQYKNARILAVDITRRSLAYAMRKSSELGYHAIDYRHGDILKLASLDRRFHIIECIGVLHHMQNPLAAWKILVDKLYPGGLMMIALYSQVSHRRVILAREYIAEQGYQPTASDIRRFRRDILKLPDEHPLASIKWLWRDFYNTSECRDLFFHVQAHRYTLPEVKAALAELGLRFLTFTIPSMAYRARFPDDRDMTSLDNWNTFEQENPDTFLGMYQFWVQKVGDT